MRRIDVVTGKPENIFVSLLANILLAGIWYNDEWRINLSNDGTAYISNQMKKWSKKKWSAQWYWRSGVIALIPYNKGLFFLFSNGKLDYYKKGHPLENIAILNR